MRLGSGRVSLHLRIRKELTPLRTNVERFVFPIFRDLNLTLLLLEVVEVVEVLILLMRGSVIVELEEDQPLRYLSLMM
jgi:hypothetical protein